MSQTWWILLQVRMAELGQSTLVHNRNDGSIDGYISAFAGFI